MLYEFCTNFFIQHVQVIEYPEIPVKKQRISHLNAESNERKAGKPAEAPTIAENDGDGGTSARATRARGRGSNLKSEVSWCKKNCLRFLGSKYAFINVSEW